jgi:hypothetical protein
MYMYYIMYKIKAGARECINALCAYIMSIIPDIIMGMGMGPCVPSVYVTVCSKQQRVSSTQQYACLRACVPRYSCGHAEHEYGPAAHGNRKKQEQDLDLRARDDSDYIRHNIPVALQRLDYAQRHTPFPLLLHGMHITAVS